MSIPLSCYFFFFSIAVFTLTSAVPHSQKNEKLSVSNAHKILERQSAADGFTVDSTCECGVCSRKRIVGGTQAVENEYCWIVGIYWSTGDLMCGGAVLNHNYILSASHCFEGVRPDEIYVMVGDYITGVPDSKATQMGVSQIILHEGFGNLSRVDSDIALLKTHTSIVYSDRIRPICLPPPDSDYTGETGVTAGWGTTSFGGTESSILLEVEIPILDDDVCIKMFEGFYTTNMVCGGYLEGGKDACQGDSGGPLFLPTEKGFYIVCGVISFGRGCATPGYPGVYTRVTKFLPWIAKKIKGTSICTTPSKKVPPKCGAANPRGVQNRIIGGFTTNTHQYPWTAALIVKNSAGNHELRCGATLISESWLLTTGRCVSGFTASQVSVVLGDHDVGKYEGSEVQRLVKRIVIHPNFQSSNQYTHDIALIEISPVEFTTVISPICLPPEGWDATALLGVDGVASGWGKNNQKSTKEQEVFLKIISNAECRRFYGTQLTSHYICAGGEVGKDICNNDYGGQFSVTADDGLYRIIGISAFSAKDNCANGYPAGFSLVTAFLQWITDTTGLEPQ